MPILTFSPPAFSSTASSSTIFRKTWDQAHQLHFPNREELYRAPSLARGPRRSTYIVTSEDANDLAAAVELNKEALVEVLQNSARELVLDERAHHF